MNIGQAKAKAISENPFYGLRHLLALNKYYEKVTDDTVNARELDTLLGAAIIEAAEAAGFGVREDIGP